MLANPSASAPSGSTQGLAPAKYVRRRSRQSFTLIRYPPQMKIRIASCSGRSMPVSTVKGSSRVTTGVTPK